MLQVSKRIDADVVVCGGGPAGFCAGLAAARDGRRTVVLEWRESLGGLYTNGYITGMAGYVDGYALEFLQRMEKKGYAEMKPHLPSIDPEAGKGMMEQMLLAAGCRILYGAHVCDCEVKDGRIASVIVYCKSGKLQVTGRVFIDCTGDADLAFAAGVPTETSSAEYMGLSQSVTMGFRLAYVNEKKFREADAEWRSRMDQRKHRNLIVSKEFEALEKGDLPEILSPGNLVYTVPGGADPACTDVTLDATHTFDCRCDDVTDLTRQIVDQHRKVYLFTDFLRKYVPGFEQARLVGLAGMNGIRDSRRIVGEYVLRDIDLAAGRKFDDGIAIWPEMFDTHVPTPGFHTAIRHIHAPAPEGSAVARPSQDENDHMMHPFVSPEGMELRTDPRDYAMIPYRSLVPVGIDNLLAAGRCYSAEFHALGATRIIATSMSMGQAAGHAAALAAERGVAPRELDGRELRALLVREGARLNEPPAGYWETMRNAKGEYYVNTADVVAIYDGDKAASHIGA